MSPPVASVDVEALAAATVAAIAHSGEEGIRSATVETPLAQTAEAGLAILLLAAGQDQLTQ